MKKILSNQKGIASLIVICFMTYLAVIVGALFIKANMNTFSTSDLRNRIVAQSVAEIGAKNAAYSIQSDVNYGVGTTITPVSVTIGDSTGTYQLAISKPSDTQRIVTSTGVFNKTSVKTVLIVNLTGTQISSFLWNPK